MSSQREYFEMFYQFKTPFNKNVQAYEELEKAWMELYGVRKYKNYRAFRTMKSRYLARVRG